MGIRNVVCFYLNAKSRESETMTGEISYWCPNGCGKRVRYAGYPPLYVCEVCKSQFKKEEIKNDGK